MAPITLLVLWYLFLVGTPPCFAQTPTLVSGTVKDANGVPYSFAKVSASLTGIPPNVNATIIVNGVPTAIAGQQNASADVNGNFNMNLFCNTAGAGCSVISPSGTQWQFTINETGTPPPLGTGPQTCSATVTITGASQSLSGSFSACPALSNSSSGGGGGGLGSPALPATANLIAENLFLDGSGTVMADSSGNGNTCTLAGGGAAPTVNPVASGGGLTFLGTSNQFCSWPAALNAAKTFVIAMNWQMGTSLFPAAGKFQFYMHILSGNGPIANSLDWLLVDNYTSDTWAPGGQGDTHFRTVNGAFANYNSSSGCNFLGTGVVALSLINPDTFYINGQPCINRVTGNSSGLQTAGNIQLGGSTSFSALASFFTGTIYCVAAWNVALTPPQVAQASQALQSSCLTQRGIPSYLGGSPPTTFTTAADNHDSVPLEGDSLFAGINIPSQFIARQPVSTSDVAISGTGTPGILSRFPLDVAPLYRPAANRNTFIEWAGTNDAGISVNQVIANYCGTARLAEQTGFNTYFATMISRTGEESFRDSLNPLIRQYIPTCARTFTGVMDIGANTHLGCDGCFSNATYFQGDQIHLTAFSSVNIVGLYYANAFSRENGNRVGSTNFNTYTGTGSTIPTLLQTVDCQALSGASVPCALPWPTTAGSLITISVNCVTCTGVTINTPTDSQALTYSAITAQNNYSSTAQMRAFFAPNATAAAETLTQTFTGGSPSNVFITIQEWGGIATATPLDVASAIATGTSATPATASITTTAAGELLYGYQAHFSSNATPAFTPYGTFFLPTPPLLLANDTLPQAALYTVTGAAGGYTTSSTMPLSADAWGAGAAAFKVAAGTSTYQLQPVDIYAECAPNGTNNVALILQDGTWMTGGTVTIKNAQTSGAATCTVLAPTPYQTGVQQTIDGATSVVVANKATLVLRSKYTFTGTPGTSLVPVITWEQLQNN